MSGRKPAPGTLSLRRASETCDLMLRRGFTEEAC